MPQQRLDDANIDPILQQMRGEAMPQGVRADPLGDACGLCGVDNDAMELSRTERLEVVHPREQPAIGMHDALLPANGPPLAQQGKQVSGQERIAISPAFAALHPQEHALAIDIADFEHRHLGGTQTRAISETLVIIVRSLVERSRDNLPMPQQAQPKRRYQWVSGTSNPGTHPAPAGSYKSLFYAFELRQIRPT